MSKAGVVAMGRWLGILLRLGFSDETLSGRHTTCPICGKKKNFRFDDRQHGTWICTCGSGDGFKLLQEVKGWTFAEAAKEVEQIADFVRPSAARAMVSDDDKLKALKRVWSESTAVTAGDPVTKYLRSRGLSLPERCPNVRLHPALRYYEEGSVAGVFPTMLCRVTSPDGRSVSIHRTYLNRDGTKADVEKPRMLMPGLPIAGSAIRLFPAAATMGIAEGIETALAASRMFDLPVWSCVSAGVLESFVPPPEAKHIIVFGDNDANFTGQAAAYASAKRLILIEKVKAEVQIPDAEDTDWADDYLMTAAA